jgi:hypothetical protein
MPTSYTSLLGLALPVTGELSGTWGDTVNDYITQYVDAAAAGTQTISGSQTAVTLTVTNGTSLTQVGSGSSGSAQYAVINCTGNPAGLLTITAPASSRQYLIINATSTSQSVKIVGAGPTTGVTVAAAESAIVAWNGSDYVKVASSTADGVITFSAGTTGFTPSTATSGAVTLAGTLATTNGGTGLTSFTANRVFYASSTSAIGSSANLTFDGTTLTANNINDSSLTSGRITYAGASGNLTDSAGLTFDGTNFTTTGTSSATKFIPTGGTATGNGVFLPASNTLGFSTNGTQSMTLDPNGNLLVGVTSLNRLNSGSNQHSITVGNSGTDASSAAEIYVYSAAISDTRVLGGVVFGTTGTAAAEKRSAIVASRLSAASGTTITANLEFYTNNAGTLAERAQITAGGQFALSSDGSAAAPAITRSTDLNTGIFFPAADEIAFAEGGAERLRITSAGFTRPVAYADTVVALGNSGTATTIDLQTANVFTATLTGNCTFTLSNPIATGSSSFTLILTNDGTAGRTVAWSGGTFRFPGGASALGRTTTANAVDVWVFFTPNGGTTWYGAIPMKNLSA